MPTEHISALPGEIAKTVLMPGDPLRAKFFAEKYLEDLHCFNTIRNMLGFTGTYHGKPVSIMGSGMGLCSIGIYSYELFAFYDVENIIRVGTCGSYNDARFELSDTVLVTEAFSFSSYAQEMTGDTETVLPASPALLRKLRESAARQGITLPEARTHSTDVIYYAPEIEARRVHRMREEYGCDIIECEAFALFHNARVTGKHAAGLMQIADLKERDLHASAEERERGGSRMFEVALGTVLEEA